MPSHFNNLVLLVGTNPLPNLVVADYYLTKNPHIQTVWLVHSEEKGGLQAGTAGLADNLENVLRSRWADGAHGSVLFNKVPLSDVSDAKRIRRDAEERLFARLEQQKGIHLNYTGGTKSMSTHIYWLLKERIKGASLSFSYLDARNFRLVEDEEGTIEEDLRKLVLLNFEELIQLHGFERKNGEKPDAFEETYGVFEGLVENNMLKELLYRSEGDGYDRSLFLNSKDELAEKVQDIKNMERVEQFRPNETFLSVIGSMPEKYRLFDSSGRFRSEISKSAFRAAVKYLDGIWFEQYVAKTLEKAFTRKGMSITKNMVIHKPEWKSDEKFELDAVVLMGYQPTGISCTTMDNKAGCKSKGFEIIHRTRQIGGDEAKAVLVSLLDERRKRQLQTELAYDTGGNKGNILVLGIADLRKDTLVQRLTDFIFDI